MTPLDHIAASIAWHGLGLNDSMGPEALRNPLLEPAPSPSGYDFGPEYLHRRWANLIPTDPLVGMPTLVCEAIVTDVVERRRDLLRELGKSVHNGGEMDLQGRRILVASVFDNIPDGGVDSVTDGFFDRNDVPPWDTWVWYVEDAIGKETGAYARKEYLLSWIPPEHLEKAELGVRMQFLDCLKRPGGIHTPTMRELRERFGID